MLYIELQWVAPELLRAALQKEGRKTSLAKKDGATKSTMSQEGDIYASAIILKEVFARNGPYTEYEDLTPEGMYMKMQINNLILRLIISFCTKILHQNITDACNKLNKSIKE